MYLSSEARNFLKQREATYFVLRSLKHSLSSHRTPKSPALSRTLSLTCFHLTSVVSTRSFTPSLYVCLFFIKEAVNMRRSRSLPDSGGHLAQLLMIACLLGTPSLNAIPLPSLSSIPNQNSHIHSIPHLSKRMEIASLGTLAIEAKNARAAPDLVNAEHAAAG